MQMGKRMMESAKKGGWEEAENDSIGSCLPVSGRGPPHIAEYRWGETQPVVDIQLNDTFGYQAFPISVELAFTKN